MGVFFRASQALVAALETVCIAMMVGMAVVVLLGVIYRYLIQRALGWYDEFAEFLLVWLTFYGAVLASQRQAHIGFETLLDYVPRVVRRVAALAGEVVVLLVQAALFYYGWQLVGAASFDTAISVRWVRLSWIYSAIPIAGGLMFLLSIRRLLVLLLLPPR